MNEAVEEVTDIAVGAANEIKTMCHLDELSSYFTWANLAKIITSVLAILIFWIVYKVIKHFAKKAAQKTLQPKAVSYITKGISYCFYVVIVMYILGLFGIDLKAVWGAAGIAGVAIGFAAQTSVSNLISGLFVVTDKAMKIGDFIEVDGISGTVETVGIISVKIRTADNQIIRIPNSNIINSKLVNYSILPYRRFVFEFSVDYGTDIEKAIEVLKEVPLKCPAVIKDNPSYVSNVFPTTLGSSGININIVVWCKKEDFLQTKGDVCINTLKTCIENGINIPFNRMDVTLLSDETIPQICKK